MNEKHLSMMENLSGLLIEQFLDENRSQLTHYGILQLNQTMRDNQLAVFFRNNHFSTIWKHQVSLPNEFHWIEDFFFPRINY